MVDAQFSNAIEEFCITEKTDLQSDESLSDALLGSPVPQCLKPVAENAGLANFKHM